jgi:hypothetical protein
VVVAQRIAAMDFVRADQPRDRRYGRPGADAMMISCYTRRPSVFVSHLAFPTDTLSAVR